MKKLILLLSLLASNVFGDLSITNLTTTNVLGGSDLVYVVALVNGVWLDKAMNGTDLKSNIKLYVLTNGMTTFGGITNNGPVHNKSSFTNQGAAYFGALLNAAAYYIGNHAVIDDDSGTAEILNDAYFYQCVVYPTNVIFLGLLNTYTASSYLLGLQSQLADLISTNSTSNSNLTINVTAGAREIYATNNLSFTNWTGLTSVAMSSFSIRIVPQLVNRTIVWPTLGGNQFGVRILTNTINDVWTTLTNGWTYQLEGKAWGTNIHLKMSSWK